MLEMPLVSRVVSVPKALPIVVAVKVTITVTVLVIVY